MVDYVYEQHGSTTIRVVCTSKGDIVKTGKAMGTPSKISTKHKGEFKRKK